MPYDYLKFIIKTDKNYHQFYMFQYLLPKISYFLPQPELISIQDINFFLN